MLLLLALLTIVFRRCATFSRPVALSPCGFLLYGRSQSQPWSDLKAVLQTQLDLLAATTASTLVAVYLRGSLGTYDLSAQNPSSVTLPSTAEESTLSWLRFNESLQRESFSLPIEGDGTGAWGYLVVSLAKDHFISEREMLIFDKVVSALTRILRLGGSTQERVDLEQSNSHIVTIRTFLKMLSKR